MAGPKLLNKNEITALKSDERKREIEEGAKLARKVDTLRELSSKEEVNLKKFRDESLKTIKNDIDVLLAQKNATQAEITALEVRRKELEAPIDLTNEWKKLESDKKQLSNEKREFADLQTNLIVRELEVSKFVDREKEIEKREKEARSYLEEATKSYSKIEDLRFDMESRKLNSEKEIEERYRVLTAGEQDIVSREFEVNRVKDEIELDKKELLEKGSSLIQRESKLESDIQNLFQREELVKEKEAYTTRLNQEAQKAYDNAKYLESETKKIVEDAALDIDNRTRTLSEREQDVSYRESDLILQKQGVEEERKAIEKEKIHIASQQETLRQAWINIKRLNNK